MNANPSNTADAGQNPQRDLGLSCAFSAGTKDVHLLSMALREQWPMSPEKRDAAVKRLEEIVSNPATKLRSFHIALRALTSLSRINLQCVSTAIAAQAAQDFDERLKQLEAWQAGGGTDPAEQRPRIVVPDRDHRHDRRRVIVEREDRQHEEPDNSPRSSGGSPPAPPSPPDPSAPAADDPEDDRR